MQNPLDKPIRKLLRTIVELKPILLAKAGAAAVEFAHNNFDMQGFQGETFDPWDARQDGSDPGRNILVGKGSGHLKNSIRVVAITGNSVTIGSNVPYAQIHNEGGIIHQPARETILNYNRTNGKLKLGKVRTISQQRKIKEIRRATVGAHDIEMPERRFLGYSPILENDIHSLLLKTILNHLK